MAEPDPNQPISDEVLLRLATMLANAVVSVNTFGLMQQAGKNANQESFATIIGLLLSIAGSAGAFLATQLIEGEDIASPAYSKLLAAAVKDVTGADISSELSGQLGDRDNRAGASRVVGQALLNALTSASASPTPGNLAPSTAGAEQYMTFVTQMALEGWLQGVIGELVSLGFINNLGDLDDTLANVLGLGRMTRQVVGPLLEARVITPFRWHVNKTYRPALLSAGDVSKQVARARWSRERGIEELARQGWSEDRIEALFNAAAKFHSIADLDLLVRTGQLSAEGAVQHLRDQGYEDTIAQTELQLEQTRRDATFERALASAAVTAYVDRRIDRSTLMGFVDGNTISTREGAQILELADARRALNKKALSLGEVRGAVKAGILAVRDYREALLADGYDQASTLTLELLLRHEIDEKEDLEELRRKAAAERAAEKKKRDEEREIRKKEIEEARKLARRGDEADLERAAIRGLIPFARWEQVVAPRYDSDTVQIMRELLEEARQEYLARLAENAAAALRARNRNIDIGALQAAVMAGTLTLDEFSKHPQLSTIVPSDRAILVATLRERLDDQRDDEKARAEAEAAARRRQVNLTRFEILVRRGHRTIAQYDALLRSLELTDTARAVNINYLQVQIADDEEARAKRDAIEQALRNKGLSIEQFRRAAILRQKTPADYEAFIAEHGYNVDVRRLLGAELVIDIQEAEAARRRREQAERVQEASRLPLATLQRAARLGVVTPAVYLARLRLLEYTEDDIALELDLLLLEIADVQLRRASGQALDPALALDEDRLAEEIARRRAELLAAPEPRALQLGQLEELVLNRLKTLDEFYADAVGLGYAEEDAELLTVLVMQALQKKEAPAP